MHNHLTEEYSHTVDSFFMNIYQRVKRAPNKIIGDAFPVLFTRPV